jgi:hypothetical protein
VGESDAKISDPQIFDENGWPGKVIIQGPCKCSCDSSLDSQRVKLALYCALSMSCEIKRGWRPYRDYDDAEVLKANCSRNEVILTIAMKRKRQPSSMSVLIACSELFRARCNGRSDRAGCKESQEFKVNCAICTRDWQPHPEFVLRER